MLVAIALLLLSSLDTAQETSPEVAEVRLPPPKPQVVSVPLPQPRPPHYYFFGGHKVPVFP